MAPVELKGIREHLDDLLEKGLIQPSVSRWGSQILFLWKKDNLLRMCILPSFEERYHHEQVSSSKDRWFIRSTSGCQLFSKIDLKSGYHKLRVRECDISNNTFRNWYGHYDIFVMFFGSTDAPAVFMELMNNLETLFRYVCYHLHWWHTNLFKKCRRSC